jgi:hypothetical protein
MLTERSLVFGMAVLDAAQLQPVVFVVVSARQSSSHMGNPIVSISSTERSAVVSVGMLVNLPFTDVLLLRSQIGREQVVVK